MDRRTTRELCELLTDESQRAYRHLTRGRLSPRLYYLSYLVRDEAIWRLQARYGALHTDSSYRRRDCLVDVRVGSYRHDQVQEGGLGDNSTDEESYNYVDLPFGGDARGVRHALWRLTDARYREALEHYLRKKADEFTYVDQNRHLRSFEKRPAVRDVRWRELPSVDVSHWRSFVLSASERLRRHQDIKASHVEFQVRNAVHSFASTERTLLVQAGSWWALDCYLWLLSPGGHALPWTLSHYTRDPAELPELAQFNAEIDEKVELLRQLAHAPVVRSFSGPVLLEPRPAGLLIHEALGHRLEGNRLLSSGEGQTFKDAIGTKVLPSFLDLHDDPTAAEFEGRSLVGHYSYDDEGVPAARAQLIEAGVLRGFLTSRAGICRGHRSNGHGRSRYWQRAISRMGVTFLTAREGHDDQRLFQLLLEEIRRQGVPFGIRILHADGGETATEGYNFQAFLGEINLATRVFPDGREELIRGVNFVGTPLNAVRSIIAAGNRYEVDNAHCGAESGYLPVTTVSPSLLVSHLELQAKVEQPYTQYTYPIPWADAPEPRRPRATRLRSRKNPAV